MKEFNRETFEQLLKTVSCLQCEVAKLPSTPKFTANNIIVANAAGNLSEDVSQRFTYDLVNGILDIKNSIGSTDYRIRHGNDGLQLNGYGGAGNGLVNINHAASRGTEAVPTSIVGDTVNSRTLFWSHANNANGLASYNLVGEAHTDTYERSDGWHAGAYTWTVKPISGGVNWSTQTDVMELTSVSLRLHKYGLGNITSASITAALGALASGGPGAAVDSDFILGVSNNGHLIEVNKTTLGGANLYNIDGEITGNRNVDLRSLDLNFRKGASGSETPLISFDGGSTRVIVGGTTSEGFGTLHVKSQGAGDSQVFICGDTTNTVILRLLNSGTFRLDAYGEGNKSAADLSEVYTNGTILAPADNGTIIEVPNPAGGTYVWRTTTENSNINNWSPTALDISNVILRNGTGAINCTGLDATDAIQGTEKQIHNRGTGVLSLTNADASSTVGNRFRLPGATTHAIAVDAVATVIYNGTDWFLKSSS
tara:strand:- start:8141 stop:9586 length:1446 start_codon:yes stop_codon:yes gene_type:complete